MITHNLPIIESAQLAMQVIQRLHVVRIADALCCRNVLRLLPASWQVNGAAVVMTSTSQQRMSPNVNTGVEQYPLRPVHCPLPIGLALSCLMA